MDSASSAVNSVHGPRSPRAHDKTLDGGRICQFCLKKFSRIDAARRHAQKCTQRQGRALLDAKRGRRVRACDQCSLVKVHCRRRGNGPCDRCVHRRLDCTITRYGGGTSCEVESQRSPLPFLLTVTDETRDFVTETAIGMEPEDDPLGPACLPLLHLDDEYINQEFADCIDPALLLSLDTESWTVDREPFDMDEPLAYSHGSLPLTRSRCHTLQHRLDTLQDELTAFCSTLPTGTDGSRRPAFQHLLNASNVRSFAATFCRKRHYRYSIIHWPTFVLEEAHPALLLVVALTGAAYSFGQADGCQHALNARSWYYLADSYVFGTLESLLEHQTATDHCKEIIEICQAALLMYGLSTLQTVNTRMQHRAISRRLPALVSALRDFDFMKVRHQAGEDWKLFVQREQIIRLVSWTYCADCLLTLSCNRPPQFTLLEMRGDLPCDNATWDADEPSWQEIRHLAGSTQCLRNLASQLLDRDSRASLESRRMPLLHLHVLFCALQHVAFQSHVNLVLPRQSAHLLESLTCWQALWTKAIADLSQDSRRKLGVATHLTDLLHLLKRIIEVAVTPAAASSEYLQRVPSVGTRQLHAFIKSFISTST